MMAPVPASPPAIIVGLDCVTGLQTARILARRGVPVIGIATDPRHYCCKTRACQRLITANTANQQLISALRDLGSQLTQKAVLVPCTDMSVLTISQHRDALAAWYYIVLPEHRVVETLIDKIRFIDFAQRHQLPIPATFVLRGRADAIEAASLLSYPCVLKPPMKTPCWESHTRQKAFKVGQKNDLLALYDRCSDWTDALVVQNWVHGDETQQITCNLYFDAASQPLVTWVSRKLRQWPPGTGNGCLSEECRNDEVVNESVRLFQTAGYRGLGYVEFKHDVRSGKLYIIEPNIGRPTGRSAAAEASGIELLYTMYCEAVGRELPAARQGPPVNVKWIYFRRDLQAAYHDWRCGRLSIAHWLKSWRGKKAYAVFDRRDLRPFFAEIGQMFCKLFQRRSRA